MESLLLITAVPSWGGWIECAVPRQDEYANRTSSLSDHFQVSLPPIRSGATKTKLEMGACCTLTNIPNSVWQEGKTRGLSGSHSQLYLTSYLVTSSPPPDSTKHHPTSQREAKGKSSWSPWPYGRGPQMSCFLLKDRDL